MYRETYVYNVYTVYTYLQLYLIHGFFDDHKMGPKVEKVDPVGGLRWKAK